MRRERFAVCDKQSRDASRQPIFLCPLAASGVEPGSSPRKTASHNQARDGQEDQRYYRSSGGMDLMAAANTACAAALIGRYLTLGLAGSLRRQLLSFHLVVGRTGLGTIPPPQFGQTLKRMVSTQF